MSVPWSKKELLTALAATLSLVCGPSLWHTSLQEQQLTVSEAKTGYVVARMATLAPGGRISIQVVDEETSRLSTAWHHPDVSQHGDDPEQLLTPERLKEVDVFDRAQLAFVIGACKRSRSLSEAGRTLFGASRTDSGQLLYTDDGGDAWPCQTFFN